jgi:purine-binding chemotaxis protein CheW
MEGQAVTLFIFPLDDRWFALRVEVVERVVPAVAVTPLPGAPRIVLGVIDLEGRIVTVVDIRARFGLPEREMRLEDRLLIARTARRMLAIPIDTAGAVVESEKSAIDRSVAATWEGTYIEGAFQLDDGLVLIHDLERFLSTGEEESLESALAARDGGS